MTTVNTSRSYTNGFSLGSYGLRLCAAIMLCASVQPAIAAPGDILFSENFDNGAACGTLAPNWTVDAPANAGIGTQTFASPPCSLFTFQGAVIVTSRVIDLSGVIGVDLTVWVRKGADTFSENPDNGEDLVIEYLSSLGSWQGLQTFSANDIANGAITIADLALPLSALHSGFQLRIQQLAGSGNNFDFWHIDDVQLEETGVSPPSSNLSSNSCDDFESGLINFAASNAVRSGINADTSNSPNNSLFLRHGAVETTSIVIDTTGLNEITVWVQRGSDAFSEDPDGGEDLVIEFLDAGGTWVALETFTGAGTAGEIFDRVYPATAAMQHPNFQIRFRYTAGSGSDFDYWHVDDVCFVTPVPAITVTKTSVVLSDPVKGTTNPKAIPLAILRYTITVTNTGSGSTDVDSITINDQLPPETTLFTGDLDGNGSPFIFTDGTGANSSGLTFNFATLGSTTDGVTFLNSANTAFTPTSGFDTDVARILIEMQGAMAGATGGGIPSFTIEFEVQVE